MAGRAESSTRIASETKADMSSSACGCQTRVNSRDHLRNCTAEILICTCGVVSRALTRGRSARGSAAAQGTQGTAGQQHRSTGAHLDTEERHAAAAHAQGGDASQRAQQDVDDEDGEHQPIQRVL